MQNSFYKRYGKRGFDIIASLTGLIVLSPLFLITALLVKLSDGGPVFYRQSRIGQQFRPFLLLKFRTMVVDADRAGALITTKGDQRITPVGRFLRKTKLDELPQLINVLIGEMSIVGPRPEVAKYVEMFRNEHYNDILTIKPGITDYAAIEFRNEETLLKGFHSPEEGYIKEVLPRKITLYRRYVKEMSFFTDLQLIFLTFWRIVRS
jgi:lipopolysaccharide/colanic/teichoic acid biosynthesis glycosyltransferase